jgi:hypothetical protein
MHFLIKQPSRFNMTVGDYEPLLDRAMAMIDYKNFEDRRAKSAKNGKCRGHWH